MKNKTRIIDVSMLSSYMGRWLTLGVTILIILVAASALYNGDHGAHRDVIRVCVPAGLHSGESASKFEPFRALLSRESRRPVVLVECADEWAADCDLFVMPIDEYLHRAPKFPILPLFEIRTSERQPDKAILIAGQTVEGMELSGAAAGDVAFAHPLSINGFWLQADLLGRLGADLDREGCRFEGTREDGTPVIYSVLYGRYRWGACKLSELSVLIERGILKAGSVRVVHSEDALPEMVICAREDDSSYYVRKLTAVANLLDEAGSPSRRDKTVDLLKSHGIRRLDPVSRTQLDRAAVLFDLFGAAGGTDETIRP
jgi:hypothetical protein